MASQLEFPRTLPEFTHRFYTEKACFDYLRNKRWPGTVLCPKDHAPARRYLQSRRRWECPHGHQFSVTAGTVLHGTTQSLQLWFYAAFAMATQLEGITANRLARQFAVRRATAQRILRKLRAQASLPNETPLQGVVEVAPLELWRGGGAGRRDEGTGLVIGAAEPVQGTANRIQFRRIKSVCREAIEGFLEDRVRKGTHLRVSAELWDHISGEGGYQITFVSIDPPFVAPHELRALQIAILSLRNWFCRSHKRVSDGHLQDYLDEFTFRFNLRRIPEIKFKTLLGIGPFAAAPKP